MFGLGGGTSSYAEMRDADVVVLWGSNAREAHPIFFHHALAAKRRGAKMFVVDPRRTGTASFADRWLGLEVGTDIALANSMAREIIHAGLHRREFIDSATDTTKKAVIDGLDSVDRLTGGSVVSKLKDAGANVAYAMNAQVAKSVLETLKRL